jgi:hypothetical protein
MIHVVVSNVAKDPPPCVFWQATFQGLLVDFWAILCVSPERLYLLLRSVAIDGSWHTKNNLGHRGMFFGAALWHWKWNVPANRWFSVEKLGTQPGLDAESGIRQCPLCKHLDQFDLESLAGLGKTVSSHEYISLSQHGRYCATQLHFYRRAIC